MLLLLLLLFVLLSVYTFITIQCSNPYPFFLATLINIIIFLDYKRYLFSSKILFVEIPILDV